ncbi:ABC transporter permease [bacterium]|nr:ABC transporter permease [bacterium]
MIRFLFKGLIRDRSRSFFPILTVTAGVMLTVVFHAWLGGVLSDIVRTSATFTTGHVKVMSRSYAEEQAQVPNDLALLGVGQLMSDLEEAFPDMIWTSRITFGGLLDIPDSTGETRSQGPVMGMGISLLDASKGDVDRMGIREAVTAGSIPAHPGEILISDELAGKLKVEPGEQATFIGSTMYGSITFYNFVIAGTVHFGIMAMDRGAIIADIEDVRTALNMEDGAGEILGYFKSGVYDDKAARAVVNRFQDIYGSAGGDFDPVMATLREQEGLEQYLAMAENMSGVLVTMFIVAMSLVLWNAGLIGGLRRYGEIGVRLAIGESKSHVYRTMMLESLLIGLIGSCIGIGIGLAISFYLQTHGINFGAFTRGSSMMISNYIYARVLPETYYIGLIPGLFSTLLGAGLAGIGIYKRQTAQLFKELEV